MAGQSNMIKVPLQSGPEVLTDVSSNASLPCIDFKWSRLKTKISRVFHVGNT